MLIVRRLLWAVPVILFAVLITFTLIHLAPGSPWDQSAGDEGPRSQLSEAALRQLNARYGLDRPWWQQLFSYIDNVLHLDFGDSYAQEGVPARDIVLARLPATATLVGLALLIILPLGMGLGLLTALRHRSRMDYVVTGLATLAASLPNFVTGIFLIVLFSVGLNQVTNGSLFLPAGGFGYDLHLVLPLITLSIIPVSFMTRLTRSSVLETLRQDHVVVAHAKGLPQRWVITRHVLKNSVVPMVTTSGPLIIFLISGTVVIETLFRIPGLGGGLVQAVSSRDYPVILCATLVYALVSVFANLVVDMLYVTLDPRIRPG